MGIEHYLVCDQCKEYIDLHKAYEFNGIITREAPPIGVENDQFGFDRLRGSYWESRGLWFLWKHRNHHGLNMHYDTDDEWYELEPHLKEVFPHSEDLKLRELHKVGRP